MPKQRSTCTRCSMKRQKCDRQTPCSRCIQNNEAHLCTTEWTNGYNPAVHRKYPRKPTSTAPQTSISETDEAQLSQNDAEVWPSSLGLPLHHRLRATEGMFAPSSGADDQSKLPDPSITNGDFVSHSRSDVTDISVGALLRDKDEYTKTHNRNQTKTDVDGMTNKSLIPAAQTVQIHHLQSLLPKKYQVLRMVDYHDRCMNYWTGGI
jgi:hypothetical protein